MEHTCHQILLENINNGDNKTLKELSVSNNILILNVWLIKNKQNFYQKHKINNWNDVDLDNNKDIILLRKNIDWKTERFNFFFYPQMIHTGTVCDIIIEYKENNLEQLSYRLLDEIYVISQKCIQYENRIINENNNAFIVGRNDFHKKIKNIYDLAIEYGLDKEQLQMQYDCLCKKYNNTKIFS